MVFMPPAEPELPAMLHNLLKRTLESDPDRPVLECDGIWTSAAEVERLATRLASGLAAAGLEEGDRVAVLLPNGLEAVLCYLACFRLRLVIVPLDYQYHPLQVGYAIGHSGASILIVSEERLAGLDDAGVFGAALKVFVAGAKSDTGRRRTFESLLGAERMLPADIPAEDSPAVLFYTSGTTSRPKGVVLSREALATGVRKYLARVTLSADDVALIGMSISRPLALRCQLLPTLWVGGRVSLLGKFSAEGYMAAFRRPPSKTFLALAPAGLSMLLTNHDSQACDFSGLRLCLAGGDRVPARLMAAFERLTGVAVTVQFGSTETGPYAMNPPFGRKKPGSVGLPLNGLQVAVVDEFGADVPTGTVGEIKVSGPGVMDGYWNETALNRKTIHKGWINTGDLGRYDEDGFLWFVGRRKDLFVRTTDGVVNTITPLEVEVALLEHPAVREAGVIGVPDPACGEVPHAYVILERGAEARPMELQAFVAGRLAEFMVPAEVHIIAEMPFKGPGKIDRELLRMRAITASLVEQVPFFKHSSAAFLRDIIPRLDARRFSPGAVLVHEGDVGDEMYFLTRGRAEVVRGETQEPLAVLREGSFFGELAILRDMPRAATVRALTDIEVYALSRDGVMQLTGAHASFEHHLKAAAEVYSGADGMGTRDAGL
jgi:long-chain acyl-CoA synthetase